MRAGVSLPVRIIRQFHHVIEISRLVVAPDLEDVHEALMRAGDRLELLDAAELALEMFRPLEGGAAHHLHRAPGADNTSRQPHFAVAALANAAEEFVIGDDWRFGAHVPAEGAARVR
jgi:hypothetical protein